MKFYYILAIVLQLKICGAANILAIAPLQSKSHFIIFEALLRGLAAKGHDVDVVSHFPLKERLARYNDIPIKGDFEVFVNNLPMHIVSHRNVWKLFRWLIDATGPNLCKKVLESDALRNLKNATKKYDLLITEFFMTDCMLGFSHVFNIPSVALTTSVTLPWTASFMGFPDNPSYIPNYFSEFSSTMTFLERATNTALYFMTKILYEVLSVRQSNVHARNFFGNNLPDLGLLARNVSLFLVNSHLSVNMPRPAVPTFVEVGGIHINENYSLSEYFKKSLDTDLNGVIYLSFGSMLLTETLPEYTLQSLFDACRKVPYKIMWKARRENFTKNLDIPNNIQFEPWMPQLGILCHPNVKLFISHGGLLGTLEARHCGIPYLGIPVFADQMLNVQTNVAKGLAKYVPLNNVSEESVTEALRELLDNPKYSENSKQASKLFRDRPQTAMDTAIYWIEYVIRYKGAPHLRTVGADLPWYQYLLIDVALFYLGIISLLIFLVYLGIIFLYRVTFRRTRKIKQN